MTTTDVAKVTEETSRISGGVLEAYQRVGKAVETSSDCFQIIVLAEDPFLPF